MRRTEQKTCLLTNTYANEPVDTIYSLLKLFFLQKNNNNTEEI